MGKLSAAQVKFCCSRLGLPAGDVRRLFEAVGNPAALPVQGWVPISQLFVDPSYQRDLTIKGQRRIERIAAAWDWRKYQPITITGRDAGKARCAVIDGQHRWEAAKLAKHAKLPFYGIAPGDLRVEAQAFVALNNERTAVSSGGIFRADVAAGQAEAVTIARVCQAEGIHISLATQGHLPARTVGAVNMLRRILRTYDEAVLARALRVIALARPDELDAFQQHVLRGVADVVAMAGTLTDQQLVAGLRKADGVQLRAEMTLKAKAQEIPQPQAMAQILLELSGAPNARDNGRAADPVAARTKSGQTTRKPVVDNKTPGVRRLISSGGPSATDQVRRREARQAEDQRLIDAAVRAGRVTRCPTAAVAAAEGAIITEKDRKQLRAYRQSR